MTTSTQKDKDSLLNHSPTPEILYRLVRAGLLSQDALDEALKRIEHIPGRERWRRFLDIVLLVLGTGLLVSGIFFFFAFNWASLHRFAKLGLLEGLLLAGVGLIFYLGLDKLSGKIALSASALLVGALLAVYGQIYQTGADAYSLFRTWAWLIAGWVLISKFTPLWVIWIGLLDLSLWFYWLQLVGEPNGQLYLILFLLNGGAVLIWELANRYGLDWLNNRWTPRLLALPTFAPLVVATLTLIFVSASERAEDPWLWLLLLLFIAASALVIYVYSQKELDLFMLTLCALSLIISFNGWILEILEFETATFFIISALIISQAALVVTALRKVSAAWEAKQS